jgi:hypothetical protein
MALDLSHYGKELKAAYEDVLSDSSDTNWALFGYDKQTNDLKVVETGGLFCICNPSMRIVGLTSGTMTSRAVV